MGQNPIKNVVFIILVLFVALAFFGVMANLEALSANILLVALAAIVIFAFWKLDFLVMLKDYERAVIFRFGKVHRVGGPGWCVIFPPIESYTHVDLRTHTIDIPPQQVVTKDNIELRIDAVIYLMVMKDPQAVIKSVVEIQDYEKAAKLYVVAQIRDIIGSMTLSEVISKVDSLNTRIKEDLVKISEGWGVDCEAVEITDVKIPKVVIEAMHLEKAAEQEKLARIEKAEAHKAEIVAVKHAAEMLSDRAISYYYIRALEKMSEGKATKIIFPVELSKMAELLGGKMGAPKGAPPEELIQQYAPVLLDYLKKEKNARERWKMPAKKGAAKGTGKGKGKKK